MTIKRRILLVLFFLIFSVYLTFATVAAAQAVKAAVTVMSGRTSMYIQCRADEFLITQYSDTSIKVTCWRWED